MLWHISRRTSPRRVFLVALSFVVTIVLLGSLKRVSTPSVYTIKVINAQDPVVITKVKTKWKEIMHTAGGAIGDDKYGHQHQEPIEAPRPLEKHKYRADGLLEVNSNGAHPIFSLIRNAETEWNAKLARSSKTLEDAVAEYERRYKRLPPRGFDKWWAYIQKHKVQLPDEYDQIYEDLEPFWGMDPRDLQRIQADWEDHSDTYTIGKTVDGPITIVNYSLPGHTNIRGLMDGAYLIMDLLKEVEDLIPAFRAIFSPHDNPNLPIDWELKQQALKHAAAGTFLDTNNPPAVKLNGWIAGCAPGSPALQSPIDWDAPAPLQTRKTFIHNHRLAMDPCQHPSLFLLQGQFLSHHKGPVPHRFMPPQFSYSSTTLHHDMTPAIPMNWISDLSEGDDPEWDKKRDERLQWRGTNTGIWHAPTTRWRESQRARAITWASVTGGGPGVDRGGNVTILKPGSEDERIGEGEQVKWARWAPAMLDIAFARAPGGCAPETCKELERVFEFRKPQDVKTAGNYKYILDIDGNGWSSRFKRLITSRSLIFKTTIYPEWFTERLAPWVHYIPVQADLSDLADSLTFFRGDPNGEGGHNDLAKKIATAGREWSLKFWRKEDMTAYMFRLFLEYSRVMSLDRLDMKYVHVELPTRH